MKWLQRLFSGPPQTPAPAPATAQPPPARAPAAATPARAPAGGSAGSGIAFDQSDLVDCQYNALLFHLEGDPALDVSPVETAVLDALDAVLASKQSGAALVRRMPGLIPQLLQTLKSENFSGAELSRTISGDVVLVAAVTRLANSSMKGSGKSIGSVEHAVIVIGAEGLRHLITSVAFRPIIDINSGHYTRLVAPRIWERSERCANANRELAAAMGVDPFEAFLAGLVQHVGLIVALRLMDQTARNDPSLGSEMFCARLMRVARALSLSIGREWDFPENVTRAIAEQGSQARGAVMSPLGRLMALSDYLSKVRLLVEAGRAAADDPRLFAHLPPQAQALYEALEPVPAAVDEQPN